jgi:hypothetical protein
MLDGCYWDPISRWDFSDYELKHLLNFSVLKLFVFIKLEIHISLYLFSIAAIKNYHKLSGLNNTNIFFCSSRGQKSERCCAGLISRCWQNFIPFQRLLETDSFQQLPLFLDS